MQASCLPGPLWAVTDPRASPGSEDLAALRSTGPVRESVQRPALGTWLRSSWWAGPGLCRETAEATCHHMPRTRHPLGAGPDLLAGYARGSLHRKGAFSFPSRVPSSGRKPLCSHTCAKAPSSPLLLASPKRPAPKGGSRNRGTESSGLWVPREKAEAGMRRGRPRPETSAPEPQLHTGCGGRPGPPSGHLRLRASLEMCMQITSVPRGLPGAWGEAGASA